MKKAKIIKISQNNAIYAENIDDYQCETLKELLSKWFNIGAYIEVVFDFNNRVVSVRLV